MADDLMNYPALMEHALKGVVRAALDAVAVDGLPGEHHFYITFDTTTPGVAIAPRLKAQYPEEMTIVLQHQFWGLETDADGFRVTLSFGGASERLEIPWAALAGFVDPSVEFGLRFGADRAGANDEAMAADDETADDETAADDVAVEEAAETEAGGDAAPDDESPKTGEVVTLDSFRKK